MIEKVENIQIQSILDKSSTRLPKAADNSSGKDADVSIQVDFASFIDKAMQITQEDSNAVERAKNLLLTGQLESPENFRKAAENLTIFGI